MVDSANSTGTRVRFYGSLEAGLVAWAVIVIATGETLGLGGLLLYIATLGGMLAILGAAMRHPVYRRLKTSR